MNLANAPDVMKTDVAAQILGCDPRTIRDMVHRGDIAGVNVGRTLRITKRELERFLGLNDESGRQGLHLVTDG